MIHPDTDLRYISPEMGHGVVATAFIPRGTITWVLDRLDREFERTEVAKMEEPFRDIIDTYAYTNERGNYVLCWDHARFVNHSFNSNCISTPYDFEIAVRDIQPGEQLTDDYGYLNVDEPFRGVDEGTRRKVVYPDDLLRYHRAWDSKLEKAYRRVLKVEQKLGFLLDESKWEMMRGIASGARKPDSVLTLYYANPVTSNGMSKRYGSAGAGSE
ncbi:MAG: SET domain-containing protein [Rhodothermales bacterium]